MFANMTRQALEKQVRQVVKNIKEEIQEHLYNIFLTAIEAATGQADSTQARGAHLFEGGLHWSTYKAVVRRNGSYTNASGPILFNEQLIEPIFKHIATGWEKSFTRQSPGVLQSLVTSVDQLVHTFHDDVEKRALRNDGSVARFMMLKHGLLTYREMIADATNRTKKDISEKQKDINQGFVPVVADLMNPVYDYCTEERGAGSFKRMKAGMADHIANSEKEIFTTSTRHVQDRTNAMIKEVGDEFESSIDEVFIITQRDYQQCVTGSAASNEERLLRGQRKARGEVANIVTGGHQRIQRVLRLVPPSGESEEKEQDPGENLTGMHE